MRALLRLPATVTVGLTLALAGCGFLAPRADPSRYFVLTPVAVGEPAPRRSVAASLGLGPITLAHHLERPELVTRVGANEVRAAPFDFWAGSLAAQLAGTLGQDLQLLLDVDRIESYPWFASPGPDLVVEVDVRRFERDLDDQVRLDARWRLRQQRGALLRAGDSTFTRPAGATDPAATAAALSELVADLSREIAKAIRAEAAVTRPTVRVQRRD